VIETAATPENVARPSSPRRDSNAASEPGWSSLASDVLPAGSSPPEDDVRDRGLSGTSAAALGTRNVAAVVTPGTGMRCVDHSECAIARVDARGARFSTGNVVVERTDVRWVPTARHRFVKGARRLRLGGCPFHTGAR